MAAQDYEQCTYNSPSGAQIGSSATEKVAFYGATPVAQRSLAVQAASVVSASSFITIASNHAAFSAEVAATLTGLGLWKGSA